MSVHVVKAGKNRAAIPVVSVVRGDIKTTLLRIAVDRYADDVDLSGLSWCVEYANADDEGDVHTIGVVEPVDDVLWLRWALPEAVCGVVGTSKFTVKGVDTAGAVWQSTERYIEVTDDFGENVEYTPADVSELDQLIADVGIKVRAMETSVDGYEARVTTAVNRATQAAGDAEIAKGMALTAYQNATNAADYANDAGDYALNEAYLTNDARLRAVEAATYANNAANSANDIKIRTVELYNTVKAAYDSGALKGRDGTNGTNGTSVTHSFDGTVLTMTSASGISVVDLKGAPGAAGRDGADGRDGVDGSDASVTSENIASALGYTPANASTVTEISETISQKQDVISDLSEIRSGAALGATALQTHQSLKTINNQSLIGTGNITIEGGGGTSDYELVADVVTASAAEKTYITLSKPITLKDVWIIIYNKSGNASSGSQNQLSPCESDRSPFGVVYFHGSKGRVSCHIYAFNGEIVSESMYHESGFGDTYVKPTITWAMNNTQSVEKFMLNNLTAGTIVRIYAR